MYNIANYFENVAAHQSVLAIEQPYLNPHRRRSLLFFFLGVGGGVDMLNHQIIWQIGSRSTQVKLAVLAPLILCKFIHGSSNI